MLDVQRGALLYEKNGDMFFTGASTAKLLTVGAALKLLSPEHRFRTRVYRLGEISESGILVGDVVLVGGGDPNLSQRAQPNDTLSFRDDDHTFGGSVAKCVVPGDPLQPLRALARQLSDQGVRRVQGRVLADAALFPEVTRGYANVVISPFMINDNVLDVEFTATRAGEPALLKVLAGTNYARFVNEVCTESEGGRAKVRFTERSRPEEKERIIIARGTVPAGMCPTIVPCPIGEPTEFARIAFAQCLVEAGITVVPSGGSESPVDFVALEAQYTAANLLAEHVSPPFSEAAKVILKVSHNVHADQLPSILGADRRSRGSAAEMRGFERERDLWLCAGLPIENAAKGDGAGAFCQFTPLFMAQFLSYYATQREFPAFLSSLPVLGRDGTLAITETMSPAAGHVRAKTGTDVYYDYLNHRPMVVAKGLAGYVTTLGGSRVAFAAYLNHVPIAGENVEVIQATVGRTLGELASIVYGSADGCPDSVTSL